MGITTPTPIQRLAIQHVLDGRDVIAKAETGTGKTLAFGAGMMSKCDPARASVLALVLCPTRELAEQGQKVLEVLGKPRGIKVALVVGGEPLEPQVAALKGGAQVVVGTPGRILDLYKQRFLSFPWTEFAVLDEADVMLEIGFIDDVKMILSYMPDERQTLLFSATFPPELLKLAREYTKNPVEIATASGVSTVDTITQSWIPIDDDERPLALIRLIEQSAADDIFLVFCDRRTEVDKLMRRLERLPFSIKALHGGYDQAARFRVMSAFRTGEVKVLVATDVASRGLDVLHVTTVLNYSSPQDITDYTHRIGRTGRAGRKGRAITLVGSLDMRRWRPIQQEATWDIPEAKLPMSSRMGPRRDDRRDGPRDAGRDAPRSDRGTSAHGPRSDERSGRGGRSRVERPAFERTSPMNPEPVDASAQAVRWPEDQDARDATVNHGDVRPNRESPRRADSGRRPRSGTPHARGPEDVSFARAEPEAPLRSDRNPPRDRARAEVNTGSNLDAPRQPRRDERSTPKRDARDADDRSYGMRSGGEVQKPLGRTNSVHEADDHGQHSRREVARDAPPSRTSPATRPAATARAAEETRDTRAPRSPAPRRAEAAAPRGAEAAAPRRAESAAPRRAEAAAPRRAEAA
ncbi:MAG: DEAD/DEAH box helicase, partial [Planctomycetota bacterium]|nr:DEAD/DEAH box helicase [Planctomycetota bacterium]